MEAEQQAILIVTDRESCDEVTRMTLEEALARYAEAEEPTEAELALLDRFKSFVEAIEA